MSAVVEFLLARIAEDEAAAREAIPTCDPGCVHPPFDSPWVRVLAECEAKRQIVEHHATDGDLCLICRWESAHRCPTVRHLAAVYADHPDYDEAWRP